MQGNPGQDKLIGHDVKNMAIQAEKDRVKLVTGERAILTVDLALIEYNNNEQSADFTLFEIAMALRAHANRLLTLELGGE